MKTKITDSAYNLLIQLEPSLTGEYFDRADLFKLLQNKGYLVLINYRADSEPVPYFYSVIPIEGYYGLPVYDLAGYDNFFTAFDKGMERALALLIEIEKEKARKAEIKRLLKQGELITRKSAEEAMMSVMDYCVTCSGVPKYDMAREIFNAELDKIKKL